MSSTSLQKLLEQLLKSRNAASDRKKSPSLSARQLQEMETAYAEALGDGADAHTLAALWEEIRKSKNERRELAPSVANNDSL